MLRRRTVLLSAAAMSPMTWAQGAKTEPKLAALQQQLTGLALQAAKTMGIGLDFSHASVQRVEEALGNIHAEYNRTKSTEGLFGLAAEFGAYVITVIERNTEPGVWEKDHSAMGPNSLPFTWRGATLFPVGWCHKRIIDGPADNVWVKYQQFVLKHTR